MGVGDDQAEAQSLHRETEIVMFSLAGSGKFTPMKTALGCRGSNGRLARKTLRGCQVLVAMLALGCGSSAEDAAVMRFVGFDASDISQEIGGPMIAGLSIWSRGQPEASLMNGVSVGPPGTRTLTPTPVPSSSSAHTADIDSSADLVAP